MSAIWKLSALVTVVAVGTLVVIQAQRNLGTPKVADAPPTENGDKVGETDPFAQEGLDDKGSPADPAGNPMRLASNTEPFAADDADFGGGGTGARTASRTKPRGLDLRNNPNTDEFPDDFSQDTQTEPRYASTNNQEPFADAGDPFNGGGTDPRTQPRTGTRTGTRTGMRTGTRTGSRTATGPGNAAGALLGSNEEGFGDSTGTRNAGTAFDSNEVALNDATGGQEFPGTANDNFDNLNDPTGTRGRTGTRTSPRTGQRSFSQDNAAFDNSQLSRTPPESMDDEFGGARSGETSTRGYGANDPVMGAAPRTATRSRPKFTEDDPFAKDVTAANTTLPRTSTQPRTTEQPFGDDPSEFGTAGRTNTRTANPGYADNQFDNSGTGFDSEPVDFPTNNRAGTLGRASVGQNNPAGFDDAEFGGSGITPARKTSNSGPAMLPQDDLAPGTSGRTTGATPPVTIRETTIDASPTEVVRLPPSTPAELPRQTSGARGKVTIQKTAPAHAFLGQPLVYHITVKNVGNGPAGQVFVEDPIPQGVEIVGSIPQAELTGRRMIWRLGTMAPAAERKIAVKVIPRAEGSVGSAATVNYVADPTFASAEATGDGRITLDLQGPRQVRLGEDFEVNFKVTNNSSEPAQNVDLRDLLPSHLKHEGGSDLQYPVGTLAPGESKEITLTLTAAEAGNAVSRAVVLAGNEVVQNTEFTVEIAEGDGPLSTYENRGQDLVISRRGPKTVLLHRPVLFTTTVTNRSSLRLVNLVVVENVPEGVDFFDAQNGGKYDATKRRVIWTIENLDPNSSLDLGVQLSLSQKKVQAGIITVTDAAGNQVQSTAEVQATGAPHLVLQMIPRTGPVTLAEIAIYDIELTNRGSEPATGVSLKLDVPPELQLVEAGPWSAQRVGREVRFEKIAELGPNQQIKATVRFRPLKAGEGALRVEYGADHLRKVLSREEAVLIID